MRKSKYLVLIGVLILILPAIINFVNFKDNSESIVSPEEKQGALNIDSKKPITAGLTYGDLWIDDSGTSGNGTWADIALAYPEWCTWTGSEYKLGNITLTNPDGTGSTLIIANSSVDFIIENCTISNSEHAGIISHAGINLINASNGKIFNCKISNNLVGILLGDYSGDDSNDNEIINNTITNCQTYGVYLYYAEGCLLENNTIEGGSRGVEGIRPPSLTIRNNTIKDCYEYGIRISSPDQTILSKNTMTNCGAFLQSGFLSFLQSSEIYLNNTVNGKPIYYYVDEVGLNKNNFTHAGQPGQILLANCSDSDISGFNISDASVGIGIQFSENNNISSNIVNNNGYHGIILERNCYNNTIFNNTVNGNRYGIRIGQVSHENNITNNKVNNSLAYGIFIQFSDHCNITHNLCTENSFGIVIHESDNCIVFNNTVTDSNYQGVRLNRCHNTTVAENNITGSALAGGNWAGIRLEESNSSTIRDNFINFNNDDGLYATDSYRNNITNNKFHDNTNMGIYFDGNCDNNTIYLNSFIGNGLHAYDDGNNIWNLTIGNYWDDYAGCDSNGDGIGESSYTIPGGGGGVDNKPITNNTCAPYIPPAAGDDDDDDDDDDTGVVVVVVVVIVIASVGAGIGVIYVLIQKGIIGSGKKR